MIKLKSLKPNPGNPRFIKDEKFFQLVESLRSFPKMMELRPIVVDEKSIVLAGNMRLKALQELGYKEVDPSWIKKASDLTEEQKQEFIIKDNAHYGYWDTEALANGWDENSITSWGVDLPGWKPLQQSEGEDSAIDSPGSRGPGATDDEYSVYEQVMQMENKQELLQVLNAIKANMDLEKLEDALMVMVRFYKNHNPKLNG